MEEEGRILFWGPLNAAGDGVKCNYIIYWSGELIGGQIGNRRKDH